MGLSCIGQAVIDNFIKNPNDSRPLFLRLRLGFTKLWNAKSGMSLWNEDYISFHKKWSEGLVVRYTLSTLFGFHKIVKRKERYEFVENQDFVTFSENSEKGRPRLEYAPTLDKTSLLGLRTVLRNTSSWKMRITCSTNLWSRPLAGRNTRLTIMYLSVWQKNFQFWWWLCSCCCGRH